VKAVRVSGFREKKIKFLEKEGVSKVGVLSSLAERDLKK
jgi:hypothetical protein